MPRFRRPRSPVHLLRQVTAAALACLALVLALRPPPSAARPPGEQATVPVAVAADDLTAGAVLTGTELRPGDRVDVLAAAGDGGSVEVVATGALVLTAPPGPDADAVEPDDTADGSGLLVLAVPPDTAGRLAAAAAAGTLTVTLGRR